MRRDHRVRAVAVVGAAMLLAGCASSQPSQQSPAGTSRPGTAEHAAIAEPVKTSETGWAGVADALGRPGKLFSGATVYRVSFPRRDLSVTTKGVRIKPGFALGSYAAFARYGDGTTMVMGDLVVTEAELAAVTDALRDHGIAQTALHKHLLEQTPPVWWTHFEAEGTDPVALARGLKAVLDATATPPAAPATPPAAIELDTTAIDTALGTRGTDDGGIYKFSFARKNQLSVHGRALPPAMGVTTALNFQPTGGAKAAINGDFAMTADEVPKVIGSLRAGGIDIVELHNHALDEAPRLFYLHFWANDDAATLARALRKALDTQNVTPAS